MLLLMRVRKMDYINYGMEVLNGKCFIAKTSEFPNHLHKWRKKNKLNKIDIVGFFFSEGKTGKRI
jgi:hypothetical protein